MKKIIPALIMLAVVFTACGGGDENATETKAKDKYEQTKETLEQTEKKNPKRFLSVDGHDKKNLARQTVIKGTISNKATLASYKDIDVELSFYSKTGALLLKDHEVVYKVVTPGSSENFKYKTYAPKGTDSIAMKISSAKVE
jgi:PBP1b-binding outer membrane lipoprotein LpoB